MILSSLYILYHIIISITVYIYIFFVDYTTNTCMLYKLYIYIYYDLVQLILFTKYARYWTFFLASSLICFGHPSGHFPPWWSSWHRRWLRRQTRRWCSCYLWLTHWTSGKKTCLGNKSMEICGRKIWEQRNLRIVEKKSGKSMELWEEKMGNGNKNMGSTMIKHD